MMVAETARAGANGGSALVVSIRGFVARVTLNRPERSNALDRALLLALKRAFSGLRRAPGVRVVVLSGAGRSFCSGVDISEEGRREFYKAPQQIERLYQENGQEVVRGLQFLPQVTIAEVNGPAIGWGTCLATACDFRVVSAEAFFRIPEIGLGMYYDVGCLYGLLSLVGPAQAKRMTMTGEDIGAAEALSMGLADRVVSPADLSAETLRLATSLGVRDSAALRIVKRQMCAATAAAKRHLGLMELELTTAYYGSNSDGIEGLAARKEARSPVFARESEDIGSGRKRDRK